MASVAAATNPDQTKDGKAGDDDSNEEFVVVNPNQYTFVDPTVDNQQQLTTPGIIIYKSV